MKKIKKLENKSQSDSSCSPDSYNHNTSNKKNWKLAVAQDGELFFIKRSKKPPSSAGFSETNNSSPSFNQSKNNIPLNSLKLSTIKNADINKELYLIISSMDRYRFGRRSSIIESMLGFGVVPFSDNFECLMITNIIDNSLKLEYPHIHEGDWFKSMDNIEVRTENIDKLLLQYTRATKVRLTFKSSHISHNASEEDTFEMGDIHSFEDFANNFKQLENKSFPDNQQNVFLTLIIDREYFQNENNEFLFYYPFLSNNFLYTAKGSFLTLDSLITNDLRSMAIQSIITVNHIKYFITYGHLNDTLVVCAFASTHQSKQQTKANFDDFISFLKFNISDYQSLQARQYLGHVCDIFKHNIKQNADSPLSFGLFTGSSLGISLPKEAQLRICDALSEFESMDHKKWNETHKTSSDFIVCGTALYYSRFLLSSNLPVDLRTSIECFLRVKGISSSENIKEMYIWEEIRTKLENNANKHYLAICLRNDLMLVTVMKSPQQKLTNSNISCIPYMEEIANTVDYLLSTGIDFVSQFWIDSAKRPSLKKISQSSAMRKFTIQKDISLDYIEGNNPSQELPPHSLLMSSQSEDGFRRNFESESVSDGFNDFKDYNKDCEYIEPLLNEVKNIMPMNWTAGWSNYLKYFLYWNCSDGIIMSPLKPMCSEMHLNAMKENILNIHNLIHRNYKKKLRDTASGSWNRNVVLREHGISINLKNNDSQESETIFIIGRLFAFPLKEIFVCFGPSYSQNLVELAFRMSLLNVG